MSLFNSPQDSEPRMCKPSSVGMKSPEMLIASESSSSSTTVIALAETDLDKILSTQLSEHSMCALGEVDDERDEEVHSLSIKLKGRPALVYFVDEPSEYFVDWVPTDNYALRPATLSRRGHGPAVIDPRCLSDPLNKIPNIKISDRPHIRGYASGSGGAAGGNGSTFAQPGGSTGKSVNKKAGDDKGGSGNQLPGFFSGGGGKGSRGTYTSYNASVSDAVGELSKLPQMPIGAIELLTFFPHHTKWPAVMLRLYRNDWSTVMMAKASLHARGRLTRTEWTRRKGALRHQIRTVIHHMYGNNFTGPMLKAQSHPDFAEFVDHASGDNHDLYDVRLPVQTSGHLYQPPRNNTAVLTPALVHQVISGVVNFPTGEDAGQLTQALQWCVANGYTNYTTDDLPTVIQAHNFTLPGEADNCDWDQNAAERFYHAVPDPTT